MATTMNETVVVKIKGDTTDLEQKIDRSTGKLNNFGKAGGASLGMSAEAAEQLHESLESIRALNFATLLTGISSVSEQFNTWKNTLPDYKDMVKGAQEFLDKNSAIYEDIPWEGLAEAKKNYNLQMKEANDLISEGTGLFGAYSTGAAAAAAKVALLVTAVVALIAATRTAIRTARELKQATADAAKIGLSVQAYKEWGFVLESVGVQADELRGLIQTLSDEQAQMAEGSEGASKAFERLGLSIGEITSMNQEQLFTETIKRLQGVENAVERTQLAYQIFGEDAVHLANIMNMSNGQLQTLINNYHMLGSSPSDDLIRKSNTLSMSVSYLSQSWKGLTNTISELLMPALSWLMNALTKIIVLVNSFFRGLFGLKDTVAETGNTGAKSMGGYTAATEKAVKAVQKLKREAMGFDEINKLPGQDSSGGSSGSGAGAGAMGGGAGFSMPSFAFEDLNLESWKKAGETIAKYIVPIAAAVGGLIALLRGNVPVALGLFAVAGISLGLIAYKDGVFDDFIKYVKDMSKETKGVILATAAMIGGLIALMVGNIPVALGLFGLGAITLGLVAYSNGAFDTFIDYVKQVYDDVKEYLVPIAALIAAVIALMTGRVMIAAALLGVAAVSLAMVEYKKGTFDPFITDLKSAYNKIKDYIVPIVALIGAVLAIFTGNVPLAMALLGVAAVSLTMTAYKKGLFDGFIKYTKDSWGNFKKWMSENVLVVFTKAYWTDKFDSIKTGAKGSFNGVIDVVQRAVNNIITRINTLSWKIPDWVPALGGNYFGFNFRTISIPRLATGGIATRSTLANIGENGAEAVLPLENNTGWMDLLADRIAAKQSGPSKIVLMVDGKELGWASINGINSITKQTGNLQLQLV